MDENSDRTQSETVLTYAFPWKRHESGIDAYCKDCRRVHRCTSYRLIVFNEGAETQYEWRCDND